MMSAVPYKDNKSDQVVATRSSATVEGGEMGDIERGAGIIYPVGAGVQITVHHNRGISPECYFQQANPIGVSS